MGGVSGEIYRPSDRDHMRVVSSSLFFLLDCQMTLKIVTSVFSHTETAVPVAIPINT